jgi:hypothetical protein
LPFLVEVFRAAGIAGAPFFPDPAVLPVGAHSGGDCLLPLSVGCAKGPGGSRVACHKHVTAIAPTYVDLFRQIGVQMLKRILMRTKPASCAPSLPTCLFSGRAKSRSATAALVRIVWFGRAQEGRSAPRSIRMKASPHKE